MKLEPKKFLKWPAAAAEFFIPFAVIASAAGYMAELTVYKPYAAEFNTAADLIFAVLIFIRLVSYPFGQYFFKSYGWVDLTASLPVLFVFAPAAGIAGGIAGASRVVSAAGLLRLLRVFSIVNTGRCRRFSGRKRVMKTAVLQGLLLVIAIVSADLILRDYLFRNRSEYYRKIYELSRNRTDITAQRDADVVYYFDNLMLYNPDGSPGPDFDTLIQMRNDTDRWYVIVNLTNQIMRYRDGTVPVRGIAADGYRIMRQHETIMLILSGMFLLVIVFTLFIGRQHAGGGEASPEGGPDEEAASSGVLQKPELPPQDDSPAHQGASSAAQASPVSPAAEQDSPGKTQPAGVKDREKEITQEAGIQGSELADIIIMLERINTKLDSMQANNEAAVKAAAKESAASAVRAASKSIVKYINKTYKQEGR